MEAKNLNLWVTAWSAWWKESCYGLFDYVDYGEMVGVKED